MKQMFMAAALVAALGAGTVFGYRSFRPAQRVSDLQLTNAEALSTSEFPKIPCVDDRNENCYYYALDGKNQLRPMVALQMRYEEEEEN